LYATYFGGNGSDDARSIAVDSTGAFVIGGVTSSTDLPNQNAYQSSLGGGSDAYVARFDSTGSTLTYGTYLGGSGTDYVEAIAVDSSGMIYAGGRTDGTFPATAGAFDTTPGGSSDGFVTKIDPTLTGTSSVIYSTYIGSTGFDYVIGLDVDDDGNAYLAGFTGSSSFPTTVDGNDRVMTGANDGFFARLSADGSNLDYSTFIGGTGQDRAKDVVWNAATGSAYVGGQNELQDGPTSPTPTSIGAGGGGEDAYVAKFLFNQLPTAVDNTYTVAEGGTLNGNVITDNTGAGVDSDPDSDPLTASVIDGPLHGTLVLNADGSFTYTPYDEPTSNFADSDSFTYQVSDGKGGTDTATVTITVTPDATNEAPVNHVPADQTTGQDLALVFSEGNGNQILIRDDAGGSAVEVTLTATNGSVTLSGTAGLSITGGADGSATVTLQGALSDINAALEGLTFTPTASYLGAASLQIATSDLGNTGTGGTLSDTDTIDIDVIAINDAPVNTVPAAQTVDQGGMVLFSSATGTAISISDTDAAGADVQVTLTATNGTLNLPSTLGLSFSVGDGTDDATMTFTGTVADINAALDGMTFVATPGFTGAASLQIVTNDLGNTGAGGAQSDSDSVAITVAVPDHTLWMTFQSDESTTGNPEMPSITGGDVVNFGGTMTFEPGTTSGTFSTNFNLDLIAGTDGATDVSAIHYVTRDISVGGIDLQVGDILLSTGANETIGGTTYNKEDVFVYRPTTAGDYSSGSFFLLIDGSAVGYGDVTGISLVEQDTVVGGVTLNAGEFLIAHGGSDKDINLLQADQLGATTIATSSILIQGSDIEFSSGIGALHLVQADTAIGDTTLQSGQLVVGLVGDDSTVGSGTPISVMRQDLFVLDVTATGAGTSVATATLFFEGLDEGLDNNNETIYGVSAQYNVAPTVEDASLAIDENSAGGTVVGSVTATDPENGTLHFAITGGNTNGAFTIDADSGQITVANSVALDFETTTSFSLTVAAIDDQGAYGTATVIIDLNNVEEAGINDAPTNTVPGAQTIDSDGMLLFSSATGTAVSIGDTDAVGADVQVTLTATNGTLNLPSTPGLSFSVGDGTDDATMTFTGTVVAINAALEGAKTRPRNWWA
jgi:VCBS repeat-containing protein